MADYTSLNALLADIQKKINESLVEDVAPAVKEVMKDEIQNEVYGVYTPSKYERRYDNGGLLDEANMKEKLVEDGVVAITNETPINDAYGGSEPPSLTEQIIEGEGYTYLGSGTGAYLRPRDFMESTRNDLRQTNAHVEALKKGLRYRGLDVK